MHITVIGSGYVGLVTAACLAEIGHQVIAVDSDSAKIEALTCGEVPIYEPLLAELLQRHSGQRLKFSAHLRAAVSASDVIFVAVGTPQRDTGEADLSQVEAVAREIAPAIHCSTLIVEKSTVPVCTCDRLRRILLLAGTRRGWFAVASNPEFLREGRAVTDFLYPDRIVIGADDEFARELLREVYRPLASGAYYRREAAVPCPVRAKLRAPLLMTSSRSAELIKHASNAFLATKISYTNMVARVAEAVGADIEEVRAGMGADPRIGGDFLRAGVGYGGSCFPKDVAAFEAVSRECGIDFPLLREVARINKEQRFQFVERVRATLGTLRGKRIGVLGLAFKEDTDDVRESPAIEIVRELVQAGGTVCAHDPVAMEKARIALGGTHILYAHDEYDAASASDALLILTPWGQYRKLDLQRLRSVMKAALIFDGRNLYAPEEMAAAGFWYHSVGRVVAAAIPAISTVATETIRDTPQQSNLARVPAAKAGITAEPVAVRNCAGG